MPVKRNAFIVSPTMWFYMLGHSIYQVETQQRLPGTERNKPHVMPPTLLVECLGALRSVPTRVRRNTAARARGRTLGLQLNAGVGPTADCADGLSPQGG